MIDRCSFLWMSLLIADLLQTGAVGKAWGASIFTAFSLSVFFKKLLLFLVLTSVNPDVMESSSQSLDCLQVA